MLQCWSQWEGRVIGVIVFELWEPGTPCSPSAAILFITVDWSMFHSTAASWSNALGAKPTWLEALNTRDSSILAFSTHVALLLDSNNDKTRVSGRRPSEFRLDADCGQHTNREIHWNTWYLQADESNLWCVGDTAVCQCDVTMGSSPRPLREHVIASSARTQQAHSFSQRGKRCNVAWQIPLMTWYVPNVFH